MALQTYSQKDSANGGIPSSLRIKIGGVDMCLETDRNGQLRITIEEHGRPGRIVFDDEDIDTQPQVLCERPTNIGNHRTGGINAASTKREKELLEEISQLKDKHHQSKHQLQRDRDEAIRQKHAAEIDHTRAFDAKLRLIDSLTQSLAEATERIRIDQDRIAELAQQRDSQAESTKKLTEGLGQGDDCLESDPGETACMLKEAEKARDQLRQELHGHLHESDEQFALIRFQQQLLKDSGLGRTCKSFSQAPSNNGLAWTTLNVDQRRREIGTWLFDFLPQIIRSTSSTQNGISSTKMITQKLFEAMYTLYDSKSFHRDHFDHFFRVQSDNSAEVDPREVGTEDDGNASPPAPYRDEIRIVVARCDPLTAAKIMWEACPDGATGDRKPTIVNFAERWSRRGIPAGDSRTHRTSLLLRTTLWWSLKREADRRDWENDDPDWEFGHMDHIYSPNVLVLAKEPTAPLPEASRFAINVVSTNCQPLSKEDVRTPKNVEMPILNSNNLSWRIARALKVAQYHSDNIVLPAYGSGLDVAEPKFLATAIRTALGRLDAHNTRDKIVVAIPTGAEYDVTWDALTNGFEDDWDTLICQSEQHLFLTLMEDIDLLGVTPRDGGWLNVTRSGPDSWQYWLTADVPEIEDPGSDYDKKGPMSSEQIKNMLYVHGTPPWNHETLLQGLDELMRSTGPGTWIADVRLTHSSEETDE